MKTIERGNLNEEIACQYLVSRGLKLVTKNFHSRFGEIDLIMMEGNTLVFVEVRFRRSTHYGGAAVSVTPEKQRRISLTASHYLQKTNQTDRWCRFDVVAISKDNTNWIKSAFDSQV